MNAILEVNDEGDERSWNMRQPGNMLAPVTMLRGQESVKCQI